MERNKKGQFVKGNISWNKGKRKILDLEFINNEHWINGKSILDISKDFSVSDRLIRIRMKENGYKIRSKSNPSEQIKKKIVKTMREKGIKPRQKYIGKPWNKGMKGVQSPWNKNKIGLQKSNKKGKTYEELYGKENSRILKDKIKENRSKQIFPIENTAIETKIMGFLEELNIKFIQHRLMKEIKHFYQCDFFIPIQSKIKKNIVLECDGCYWHGCNICNNELNKKQKKQIAKDNKRKKELIGKGYLVIRLKEHEIKKMDKKNFREIIYNKL